MEFDITNRQHQTLINKIYRDDIILLTGSGFSRGAENIKEKCIPDVEDLKKILLSEVLAITESDIDFNERFMSSLKMICDDCEYYNRSLYHTTLRNYLSIKNIKDFHKSYGSINWKKIYTLNIDDIHEKIFLSNDISFSIFDSRSPSYKSNDDVAFYKLRGSVSNLNAGVTFSTTTYHQSAGHSAYDKRLHDLISDMQTDNFLLIGASFDNEIDIEIEMLKQNTISNAFYHVSPKLSDLQQERIRRKFPNMVFIDETAESFIEKLLKYKSKITIVPATFADDVEKIGFNVITKDKYNDSKYRSPNMYKGMQPDWKDIFTNHDVITKNTELIIRIMSDDKEIKCLVITDKEISGKTTLLYRIGVHFCDTYDVIEFIGEDFNKSITQLDNIIKKYKVDNKILILVDDASWIIDPAMSFIKAIQNLNVQLILTLGQREYNRYFYVFTESNNDKYKIVIKNEIRLIDIEDAMRFINKLESKTYLGNYAGLKPEEAAKKFLQQLNKNDILIALWEFNEVSSFDSRIDKLIKNILDSHDINLKRFILLLFILEQYGGMELKLSLFFDMFPINNINEFRDQINEFINTDIINRVNLRDVKLKSRYTKLLERAVMQINVDMRSDIVKDILISLSNNHFNKLNNLSSYYSKVMWHLLRSQNLTQLLIRKEKSAHRESIFRIYESIHDYYKKFHLYWLHRAISEIKYNKYDDAEIHLQEAITVRGSSSNQMEHTKARLLLDKAINGAKNSFSLFDEGLEILNKQIETAQNDAYTYHTYVIKSCQYYQRRPDIQLNNSSIRQMIGYYKKVKRLYGLSSVMVRDMLKKLFDFLTSINKSDLFPLDPDDLKSLSASGKKPISLDALDEY